MSRPMLVVGGSFDELIKLFLPSFDQGAQP
jgi:hypothetical protein